MDQYTVSQYDSKLMVIRIDRDTLEIFIGITDYKTGRAAFINLLQAEAIALMRYLEG